MFRILTTLISLSCINILNGQISIIGKATPAGDLITDFNMTQDPMEVNQWSITISLFAEEVKFRKDNEGTVNWGGADFPSGTAILDGASIVVGESGTYEVMFNEVTGAYSFTLLAQGSVGVGTSAPNSSAALEIASANQGLLIPRMNTLQINQIVNPANGLLVYNAEEDKLFAYKNSLWAPISSEMELQDTDKDTRVLVEKEVDDDIIRFDLQGTEFGRFEKETFHMGVVERGNLFIGLNAGIDDTTGVNNTIMGVNAGRFTSSGAKNTFIGEGAGKNNKTGNDNTLIGSGAGDLNSAGNLNVMIGRQAGFDNGGSSNTFVGAQSAVFNNPGENNTFLGASSGYQSDGSGNVFLGSNAGRNQKGSNKLLIENSDADSTVALIYGEFDNDLLRINGKLIPTDGVTDVDMDTKIQLRESAAGDTIRFEVEGSEIAGFTQSSLSLGKNKNVLVGVEAGMNITSDAQGNSIFGAGAGINLVRGDYNTIIGEAAGLSLISGADNVQIGSLAGQNNKDGDRNVFVGSFSGRNNVGGSGNVFLGYRAGFEEIGSNKLYIDNLGNSSLASLIYGEFDNSLLRVNGKLVAGEGIYDYDLDTRITLDNLADEDRIRFDVAGNEAMQINSQGNVLINTETQLGSLESKVTVNGINKPTGIEASGGAYGVRGSSSGSGSSSHYGIEGSATGTGTNIGVYGSASGGSTNWAGFFAGNVNVSNELTADNVNVSNELTVDNINIRAYAGGLTDIPGSNFGSLITGPANAHIVVDVRGNDSRDGFHVRVPSSPTMSTVANKSMLSVTGEGVGIDVSDLTRGKLEVVGSLNSAATIFSARLDGLGVSTSQFTSSEPLSGFFSEKVAASEYRVFSDARVKSVIGRSNRQKDLTKLMGIQVTDYAFIDTITKGPGTYKKVIAQELAEVYPNAVSNKLQEVIPDIYQTASFGGGWVKLSTDLSIGEQVKIITKEHSEVYDVILVNDEAFKVDGLQTGGETVFVYGRLVDDFHTVDYEAISMLNVSATQAQQELLEQQQSQIDELKLKVDALMQLLEAKPALQTSSIDR
jgi:hypothetical protein